MLCDHYHTFFGSMVWVIGNLKGSNALSHLEKIHAKLAQ